MKVPLLDLKAQLREIESELKAAVLETVESTRYIMGPKVAELEERVAAYTGCQHAIGVSSGTDALLISLMALETGPGGRVVTTPYSFFATAGAVARLGATPVFVDIDPDTYNLCPVALRAWFEAHPAEAETVQAILPVHLYGQCAEMAPVLELANARGIPVVEDAAQAIGSAYPLNGAAAKAGSMGAAGCFSFFPSKNLGGLGDGGMVTTNDGGLAEKLARMRNHGAKPKYYHEIVGGNFRLDPIQAAALLVKFPRLEDWHRRRRENAAYYDQNIKAPGVKTPRASYGRENHIYNQYVIEVPDRRDEFRAFLNEKGIGNEVYYPLPFHEQKCFAYLGYRPGDFPNSERAARHTVAIPVYPELTREMQDYVIEAIHEYYG